MEAPLNFGVVQAGSIYRSSYPSERNLQFLKSLGLKSVVVLCDELVHRQQEFFEQNGIRVFHLGIKGKSDLSPSINDEAPVMSQILEVLLNADNQPMLVHCNAGKHRTGRAVACFRILQSWPIAEVLEEYQRFCGDKVRAIDIELITGYHRHFIAASASAASAAAAEPVLDCLAPAARVQAS